MAEQRSIRNKKQLEIFLEKVPDFESPEPKIEQYKTPTVIAADITYQAYFDGDIEGRSVVDLGCGTGIFASACSVLGAESVRGLDIDGSAVDLARSFSEKHKLGIEYEVMNVNNCDWSADTVFQNPPFGAQTKKADRIFLETAVKVAGVVYSIHNSITKDFVELLVEKLNCEVSYKKSYIFKIPHTFDFHKKPEKEIDVTLFRIIQKQ